MLGFIKAKDAARHSGYTQDYIGQLIRRGKITGKKVDNEWYLNLLSFICYVQAYNPEIKLKFSPILLFFCKYKKSALFLGIFVLLLSGVIILILLEPHRLMRQSEYQVVEMDEHDRRIKVLHNGSSTYESMEITSIPDDVGGVFISIDENQ